MEVARTMRNDREKMGEQPMYRPSQGHGQPKPQPQQAGAAGPRTRRGEDPLAELARLIGQEDPFKEFDAVQPRRAPVNGNGAGRVPVAAQPERRPDRYANGASQPRSHAAPPEAPRPASRFASPTNSTPPRAPIARPGDDRYPAPRPSHATASSTQARAGSESATRSHDTQPRPAFRPITRDTSMQPVRARDASAEAELRSARAPATPDPRARRPEPQPAGRYLPEEAPRHPRGRIQPDQRGYEDDYDPDYDDDAYLPEHADDIYDDVERPRRSWGFWVVSTIVVASLIAVAFLGVFAYRTIFNAPPRAAIVTKSDAPVKVEPKNTPQTAVPQSNKPIQDRVGGMDQQKTQIMRREEAPADLTRPATQPQQPSFQPQPQQAPQVQRAPQFAPPAQQQQQAPANTDNQPKRVKSVPLRSDGPAQPAVPQPQSNAPMPLGPTAQADESETQSVPHRPTAPTRTTVASLGPTPPVQTSGNYVVQVASHKTPEEAQNAWTNLRQQYGQIFTGRNADIRKVDLGDRGTFYRAMVGPMNREQANALCQNLKTQGAGCIVQTR